MCTKIVIFRCSGIDVFLEIIHKTNIYPPSELIFYKSILHALEKKVVARSFFEIKLRSIKKN